MRGRTYKRNKSYTILVVTEVSDIAERLSEKFDLEKIFGYDKAMSVKKTEELIIDLYKQIFKTCIAEGDMFLYPFSFKSKTVFSHLIYEDTIDRKYLPFDFDSNGRSINMLAFMPRKMRKRKYVFPQVKLYLKYHRFVKKNVRTGFKYFDKNELRRRFIEDKCEK